VDPLPPAEGLGALRWTGLVLIVAGLVVVLDAFARFALEGLGTPAPVAPTRTLVVSGFYRYARNPMYVAVAALIFGQAVLFASSGVAVHGVVIVGAFDSFVRLYEEPTLRETYGESYEVYRTAVPRWIRGSAVRAGGLGRTLVRSARRTPPAAPGTSARIRT
jgi:protein-S-isoprenylcysteine O-methyltransferase Ste14